MLKDTIIQQVLDSPELVFAIQGKLKIYQSDYMRRLIRNNNPRLTQLEIIELISTHLKLDASDIVTRNPCKK